MTEYGRGPGSEPWHPEDPVYGDGGWEGQQAQPGHQPAYGGQPQYHPQEPQQGQGHSDWDQQGQQTGWNQQGQHTGWNQQAQQTGWSQQGHGGWDQQGQQTGWDQQGHGGWDQQGQQTGWDQQGQHTGWNQQYHGGHGQQPHHQGGWDGTGSHAQMPYAPDPGDPYGRQASSYGGEQPDFYQTPDAYPPPQPPTRRTPEPEARPDWDPDPEPEEHAFFADGDDEDGDRSDDEPEDRRGRAERRGGSGGKGRKRRNGMACLVVLLVFGGGLGGVGYFGYQYYKERFGDAPDYAGDGISDTVTVEIPKGAGGYDIGRRLKAAGVVKSVDAFVSAQQQNPKGNTIQAGAYILHKQMSAASAVAMMLDPKSQNNVLVAPGARNARVYTAIDSKLGLDSGTTRKIALKQYKSLGLPDWANNQEDIKDPLEGFLYPGTYPAAKGMKPESILKSMIARADEAYGKYDLAAKAEELKLDDPLQVVTVASLVQAEGKTHDDYRKMAEVVYNRLKPTNTETNQKLQFDSTYNYLKGESNIHISEKEINSNKDPYNTYTNKGLPPGPIGNPGEDALKATLNPTHDGWLYFVATDGERNTEFAKTYAEAQRLKDKFNDSTGS
ncbi:endolytic transglycosylase MltG [Streptomyces actuosus]|uniref:Endolytic murein transglycosylase n=1 Tax=Streptomyces actuosus TaxID=1885 RepID=A0ABS2VR46_STRAS|nr:endolytic transglycosylase MltG [Streptomyces actuosus]MBN0045556.1 endolytic transglycosylase MltG [Streptomyces actuosus]